MYFRYLQDPAYISFIFSRAVLIVKIFHHLMIFFNEVLFTSYCCVRYFHERKDILFYIFLGFLLCHFSMQKVSAWSKLVEKHPINHFPTSRILHPPPSFIIFYTNLHPLALLFRTPTSPHLFEILV